MRLDIPKPLMTQSRSTGGKVKERNGPWWDSNPQVLTPMSPKSNALPLTLPRLPHYPLRKPLYGSTVLVWNWLKSIVHDTFSLVNDYPLRKPLYGSTVLVWNWLKSIAHDTFSLVNDYPLRKQLYGSSVLVWNWLKSIVHETFMSV